ncbi:hypothetical protein [Dyadobacter psychrophilus]|uniref:hypothetical protein n=1 Tax=Dyadobacter psychrophilus TaxID=651661 RepID=UPI001131B3A5|nr:hypothetical protein [Dyadobacter psychrophilus]
MSISQQSNYFHGFSYIKVKQEFIRSGMPQTHQFTILLSQRLLLFGLMTLCFVAQGATIREISSPDGKTKLSTGPQRS